MTEDCIAESAEEDQAIDGTGFSDGHEIPKHENQRLKVDIAKPETIGRGRNMKKRLPIDATITVCGSLIPRKKYT